MYIKRTIEAQLKEDLKKGKILVLYGPRQVGKTTLLKHAFNNENVLYLRCDESEVAKKLIPDSVALREVLGKNRTVVFDEMQMVPNAGLVLKIIHDAMPDVRVIATGSSAFDLANKLNEPLTGRHFRFMLYPFTFGEIEQQVEPIRLPQTIESALIHGSYPEVFLTVSSQEKQNALRLIADSYLYRDILTFSLVKDSRKIRELLAAIGLQLGSEVSYSELANHIGIDQKTVERYIDLLEKSFVIFRLHALSRNVRNELRGKVKIYFYDNGIRNALINNFNSADSRTDMGALWENYCVAEFAKQIMLGPVHAPIYFWRTYAGAEIDFISEKDGILHAYEFTRKSSRRKKLPKAFAENYQHHTFSVVTSDNLDSLRQLLR